MQQNCAGIIEYCDNSQVEGIAFHKDDMLVANIRPYLKKAWFASFSGACSTDVLVVHATNVEPRFLHYLISNDTFFSYVMTGAKGSKMPRGDKTHIIKMPTAIPSSGEQIKIASFIEILDSRIDIQKQIIEFLKKYKRGVINRIFTSEDGKWKSIRLGDYVSIMRGGSPRPIDEYITTERNGVNWIKIGDAPSDALYVTKAKEKIKLSGVKKSRRVYTGDLILSNSMSFGRPYILKIDGCIHDGWLLIRDEQNLFDKRFLCYYLGSDIVISQYKRYAAGSCVNNLNSELVGDVEIHYPPLETQQYIAKILEALDSKIEIENSQFLQLEQMKSALMQQLFI